jgi:hypothetical protein
MTDELSVENDHAAACAGLAGCFSGDISRHADFGMQAAAIDEGVRVLYL